MKIVEINFPEKSLLFNNYKKYHYTDCFQGAFVSKGKVFTPTEVANVFFLSIPKFAQIMLRVRNKAVSLLGLKASGDTDKIKELNAFDYKKNDQLGNLNVFDINSDELVFGMDDKHLDFKASLLLEQTESDKQKIIRISTAVLYHNRLGHFYFFLIKPFHRIIMKLMLKNTIKELKNYRV